MDNRDETQSPRSRIAAHLARRKPLTAIEQRALDRDGDGLVTARDLYLAAIDQQLTAMPDIVPASRVIARGHLLELTFAGKLPEGLRVHMKGADWRRDLEFESSERDGQTRLALQLPDEDAAADARVDIELWVTAPRYTPARIALAQLPSAVDADQESPRDQQRQSKRGNRNDRA